MRKYLILISALLLQACSNTQMYSNLDTLTEYRSLQSKEIIEKNLMSPKPYKVQVGDVLDIKFKKNPELDENVTVAPDGTISTRFVQSLFILGKNPKEINRLISKIYSKDLVNPELSVILSGYSPIKIYVGGEVRSPGEYFDISPDISLLKIIAKAGGVKNTADLEKVMIIRKKDNHKTAFIVNYKDIVKKGKIQDDIYLTTNDFVYIPKSKTAENYIKYEQYFKQYINPNFNIGASASHRLD